MSKDISTKFSRLKIQITPAFAKNIHNLVLQYELRKEHPLVLNSAMLGVNKISFTTNDRALIFDICGIYENDIASLVRDIDAIDNNFRVISDSFNLLCIYLVHLILKSKLSGKLKETTIIDVFLYWQYRFFSSIVNHYFPHGANHDIMQQVVENLSLKYDIKVIGTWKKVFTNKAKTLMDSKSIHLKALTTASDDKRLLYVITDVQTRMRSQLKNITALYYETKEANDFIKSASSSTEIDGKRVIREYESGFETVSHHIFMRMQNKSAFINTKYIDMILAIQKNLNRGILNRTFHQMVDIALHQVADESTDKIINRKDGSKVYKGLAGLVHNTIYVIYENALSSDSVNVNNKLEVFYATRNLFSTHRTNNTLPTDNSS